MASKGRSMAEIEVCDRQVVYGRLALSNARCVVARLCSDKDKYRHSDNASKRALWSSQQQLETS